MIDPQEFLDSAYRALKSRRIDCPEYVALLDEHQEYLLHGLPKPLRANLLRRMGGGDESGAGRSLGRFALRIYDATLRERFLADSWLALLDREDARLEDAGIDNEGRVVLDTRGGSGAADFVMHVGKARTPLEVKFNPSGEKATFKVADLESYRAQGATILVVSGRGAMVGPNGDPGSDAACSLPADPAWYVVAPAQIPAILEGGEAGRHFDGRKPTVRIYRRMFAGLGIAVRSWGPFDLASPKRRG